MKTFWTCWVKGTDGGSGYQHPTFESAKTESERLARLPINQGKKVYVFECKGASSYNDVNWERVENDELPF